MKFTKAQQQIVLVVLIGLLVLINGYLYLDGEKPKTAPLTYTRGATAVSPVRQGPLTRMAGADPLNLFLERRREKFPAVVRDIFRMDNPVIKSKVTPTTKQAIQPVRVKTQEELAAEAAQAAAEAARAAVEAAAQAARTDLMKFQVLGYLTEKESTLFLSKEGELFIVKKGSALQKSYKVKETTQNHVILLDTITGVEVQLELPSGDMPMQQGYQQLPLKQQPQPRAPERSVVTMPEEPPSGAIPPGVLQQQLMQRWQQHQQQRESGDGRGTPDTSSGTISPRLPPNRQPARTMPQWGPKAAPEPAQEKWLNE